MSKRNLLLRLSGLVRLVNALMPIIMRPIWLVVRSRQRYFSTRHSKTEVLLVCHNLVAAQHLQPIVELLKLQRPDWQLSVANDHFPAQEIRKHAIKASVQVRYVPILLALWRPWSLVIYVNQPWGFGAWIAPCVKKAYINHGLYTGKINNSLGEDGVYGHHRTHRPHRDLLFDRMIAASKAERQAALHANYELADVVVVGGSLMADCVYRLARRRTALRRQFGIPEDATVVHVISTWGADSLAATSGPHLRALLAERTASLVVVVSIHPRFDKFGGTSRGRQEILRAWEKIGARVDRANACWREFTAISDAAIADHSSLALYHVMLRHALVLVSVPARAYVAGGTFDVLQGTAPILPENVTAASLMCLLGSAPTWPDGIIDRLLQYRESADTRHLQVFDDLVLAAHTQ